MISTIRVERLGKAYRRYARRKDRLLEWLTPWAGPRHIEAWVLKDISFRLLAGEAIGVLGNNGAGKSTLLKLISGTTQPTSGRIETSGRVAALLELGMGFHPDFTGRQNAVMAGQLLGLTTPDVIELLPAIEDFADIGSYIDEPVRVYSSGMQVRLAFSVATAVRPDVLIVDEALSVGDAQFQHKSIDRIRRFRSAGTSLLIVSHDRTAIQSICDRAILLERGSLIKEGAPEEVADFYNALIAERGPSTIRVAPGPYGRTQTVSGTGAATVERIELVDGRGYPIETADVGQPVALCVKVRARQRIERLVMGYMIKDRLGQPMFGTNTHLRDRPLLEVAAGDGVEFRFAFPANLGPGSYSVTTSLSSSENHLGDNFEWRDLALVFHVSNLSRSHFVGCNWLEPEIGIDRQCGNAPALGGGHSQAALTEPGSQ